eukprot:COSAG02_NODE_11852_length_1642_cov_18.889825_3_plen_82_part_01
MHSPDHAVVTSACWGALLWRVAGAGRLCERRCGLVRAMPRARVRKGARRGQPVTKGGHDFLLISIRRLTRYLPGHSRAEDFS